MAESHAVIRSRLSEAEKIVGSQESGVFNNQVSYNITIWTIFETSHLQKFDSHVISSIVMIVKNQGNKFHWDLSAFAGFSNLVQWLNLTLLLPLYCSHQKLWQIDVNRHLLLHWSAVHWIFSFRFSFVMFRFPSWFVSVSSLYPSPWLVEP